MATTPQRPPSRDPQGRDPNRTEVYEPRSPTPQPGQEYPDAPPPQQQAYPQSGEEVSHHDVVQTGRAQRGERAKEAAEAYRLADDAAYRRATEGVADEEMRDKILALGGDATRASPVIEQSLPAASPGITTTTGAYRSPIDPTTAAVPAPDDSEIVMKMRGFPTVGSGRKSGTPEKLYQKPEKRLVPPAERE